MASPEFFAERVLDQLNITDRRDRRLRECRAWERGAVGRAWHLAGAEARLSTVGRTAVITVSTAIANPQRKRFGIAHELGHFEMQHRTSLVRRCSNEDLNSWRTSASKPSPEQLANEFAAALLLPKRFFAHQCVGTDPSLDHVADLAGLFDVSLTATAIRYTAFCEEPVAVVLSHNGHIKWFQASPYFDDLNLFIPIGDCLDASTVADRILERHVVTPTPTRVPASAWFAAGAYRPEARIVEQSWAMPSYYATLTLLWVDQHLEDSPLYW